MYDDTMTGETPAEYYKRNGPCQHECLKSCSVSKECLKQSARLYGPIIERDVRMRRLRRQRIAFWVWLGGLCAIWFYCGYLLGAWLHK